MKQQVRKTWIGRVLSLCLTIMLMLSIFPMVAFAVEDNGMSEANGQESLSKEAIAEEEQSVEVAEPSTAEISEAEVIDIEPPVSEDNAEESPVIEPASLASGYSVTDDSSGSSYGIFSTMSEAVNACPDNVECTITINGDDTDIGARVIITSKKRIILTSAAGNNYTIIQTNASTDYYAPRHFTVYGELTLKNITLSGIGSTGSDNNGGVNVTGGGTLNMGSGTVIKDCNNKYGAAVLAAYSGTFNMSDGIISGNNGANAVHIGKDSTSNISGGTIKGNTGELGGGVLVAYSTLNMSGGTICNNTARCGGGVYVAFESTINMSGGTISNNTATTYGGGLCLDVGYSAKDSTLNMSGGTISDNTAQTGGGIYTSDYSYADPALTTSYSNITISGTASVTGNTAETAYLPPSNAADFTSRAVNPFDGSLLDNNNINYIRADSYFSIMYNANGGTGNYSDADIASGTTYEVKSLDDTGISNEGYTFTGWNTQADGNGISYAAKDTFTLSGNVTLYAQWKEETTSLKANDNGNSNGNNNSNSNSNGMVQTEVVKSSAPKTGDDTNILIPLLLLVSSLGGIIITLWSCKRSRSRGTN